MRSLVLFVFVMLAVFCSLAAAKKKPSRHCQPVIKTYGPQCGVKIKSLSCKKFFEKAGHGKCYDEFLETFES